jgi:hypothetical protein
MEAYGFVVMGIEERGSVLYRAYMKDSPVGIDAWRSLGELSSDIIGESAGFPGDVKARGIPIESRHPYKPHEYLFARRLGGGEMKALLYALNESGGGLAFYEKDVENVVFFHSEHSPAEAKRHRRGGRMLML